MLAILLVLAAALSEPPDEGFERAVLHLSGVCVMEELDESEIDRYQHLYSNPLKINTATRSRLIASGLLSLYQVEALMDYRVRCGEVLSFTELSLIDGFGEHFVENLKLFISLQTGPDPLKKKNNEISQATMARTSFRQTAGEKNEWTYGFSYEGSFADRVEFDWASRTTYSDQKFSPGTISAAYYGKGHLGKVVLGNFNARFGQGLTVWSGFSMSGFSTASAFVRNGTGLGPTKSFTSSLRGIAADMAFGHYTVSMAVADKGIAILSGTWVGKSWSVGLTGIAQAEHFRLPLRSCLGADFKIGFPGGAAFGELCWSYGAEAGNQIRGSIAALAGAFWIPSYGHKLSLLIRYYPSDFEGILSGAAKSGSKCQDEYGASFGAQGKFYNATLDCVWKPSKRTSQYKLIAQCQPEFCLSEAVILVPSLRVAMKYVPQNNLKLKTDLRAQADLKLGNFLLGARYNALHYREWSSLGYAEGGYAKDEGFKAYLRAGIFKVDNWDDRIYVYERDAPGNFNVPSFYGRGWWTSAVLGYKRNRRPSLKPDTVRRTAHAAYLRIFWTAYPFMLKPKDSRLEIKLEYDIRF